MKYWKRIPTLQKEFINTYKHGLPAIPVLGPLFIVYRRGYYLWTVFVWWFLHVSFRLFFSIIQGILGYTMKRMLLGNLQRNTWHNHPNFRGLVWESSIFSRICFRKLSETIMFQRNYVSKKNTPQKHKKDHNKKQLSQAIVYIFHFSGNRIHPRTIQFFSIRRFSIHCSYQGFTVHGHPTGAWA